MKTKCVKWLKWLAFGFSLLMVPACDNDPVGTGDVEFEITDAPTDDSSVDAVMVTVADVMIDGKSVSGFSKQTIDLKAYQEGRTKLLANASQIDARTHQIVTLVLDLNEDVDGNFPGCYVRTTSGVKYQLKSTASGKLKVNVLKNWSVRNNAVTKVVLDFDLRKAISYSNDSEARYQFVADDQLSAAVRLVVKENTGSIEGTCSGNDNAGADKIVVYAYKKGTFNASLESMTMGEDGILFSHAVTSAEVKDDLIEGSYTLSFLEAGEYELYFAGYSHDSSTSRLSFTGMLDSETSFNGSLINVLKVQSGLTCIVTSEIK